MLQIFHSSPIFFDIIIANHVLYHISDVEKSLSEVSRVLNNTGIFFATTIGKNNMQELKMIIDTYFPNIENDIFFNKFLENFSLENGLEKTKPFFRNAMRIDYSDNLIIPSPAPIREYVESFNFPSVLDNEEKKMQFERLLKNDFDFTKGLFIRKEIGLFKCEK
jgi:SAM-dependent methyltransferase